MTDLEKKRPASQIPGALARLSVDIMPTEDPGRFTFTAVPVHGELDRPWRASGDVARGEQGLKITRLEVSVATEDPSGITGALMRQMPLGTLLDHVRAVIAVAEGPTLAKPAAPVPVTKGGRTPMSDDLLRAVALAYLFETAPDKPGGAVRRIAETFGRPEETIRTWIGRARKGGWLGPSIKGRAGAEPGPKLREEQ